MCITIPLEILKDTYCLSSMEISKIKLVFLRWCKSIWHFLCSTCQIKNVTLSWAWKISTSIPKNKGHANEVLIYLVMILDKTEAWVLELEYRLTWVHLHWIPDWSFHNQIRPFVKEDTHWVTVISWSAITGQTRLTAAFSNSIENAAVASVLISKLNLVARPSAFNIRSRLKLTSK